MFHVSRFYSIHRHNEITLKQSIRSIIQNFNQYRSKFKFSILTTNKCKACDSDTTQDDEDEKLMENLASFNVLDLKSYTVIDLKYLTLKLKKKWKQQDTHFGNKSQEKKLNIIFSCGKNFAGEFFFFRFVISRTNLFHK